MRTLAALGGLLLFVRPAFAQVEPPPYFGQAPAAAEGAAFPAVPEEAQRQAEVLLDDTIFSTLECLEAWRSETTGDKSSRIGATLILKGLSLEPERWPAHFRASMRPDLADRLERRSRTVRERAKTDKVWADRLEALHREFWSETAPNNLDGATTSLNATFDGTSRRSAAHVNVEPAPSLAAPAGRWDEKTKTAMVARGYDATTLVERIGWLAACDTQGREFMLESLKKVHRFEQGTRAACYALVAMLAGLLLAMHERLALVLPLLFAGYIFQQFRKIFQDWDEALTRYVRANDPHYQEALKELDAEFTADQDAEATLSRYRVAVPEAEAEEPEPESERTRKRL